MVASPGAPWSLAYVAGSPRCGSTLVGNALGSADGAIHVGELFQLWAPKSFEQPVRRCGCGELLVDCQVWRGALDAALGGGTGPVAPVLVDAVRRARDVQQQVRLDRRRWLRLARPGAPLAPDERWYLSLVLDVLGALAEQVGARTVIDSSKSVPLLLLLARADRPVGVVHLVRDPRGVVCSRLQGGHWETSERRVAMADTARWVGHAAGVQVARRQPDLRVRAWRYADFAAEPQAVLADMGRHLGLGPLPAAPAGAVAVGVNHSAWGNKRSRFTSGDVQVRADERWRSELDPPGRWIAGAAAPLAHVVAGRS